MPSCIVEASWLAVVCLWGIASAPILVMLQLGILGLLNLWMVTYHCRASFGFCHGTVQHPLVSVKMVYACCCLQLWSLQGDFQNGGEGGSRISLCLSAFCFCFCFLLIDKEALTDAFLFLFTAFSRNLGYIHTMTYADWDVNEMTTSEQLCKGKKHRGGYFNQADFSFVCQHYFTSPPN